MYRCSNCGYTFDEPDRREVCWESYFGVKGYFSDYNYGTITECPSCGSEDFSRVETKCRKCRFYRPDERYKGVIGWCEAANEATEASDGCYDGEPGPQTWLNGKEVKE